MKVKCEGMDCDVRDQLKEAWGARKKTFEKMGLADALADAVGPWLKAVEELEAALVEWEDAMADVETRFKGEGLAVDRAEELHRLLIARAVVIKNEIENLATNKAEAS